MIIFLELRVRGAVPQRLDLSKLEKDDAEDGETAKVVLYGLLQLLDALPLVLWLSVSEVEVIRDFQFGEYMHELVSLQTVLAVRSASIVSSSSILAIP